MSMRVSVDTIVLAGMCYPSLLEAIRRIAGKQVASPARP
jgi:hypothetical protein